MPQNQLVPRPLILNAAKEAVEEAFNAVDAFNGDVAREVGQERRFCL